MSTVPAPGPVLPVALQRLQDKLARARADGTLMLQNGDTGGASAPSNIALLKYWGKVEGAAQRPVNASLSYTLGGFRSFTEATVRGRFFPADEARDTPAFVNTLSLNGADAERMPEKMDRFVRTLLAGFAPEIGLAVTSFNNFPTACGIASSASGYAALVGAVADLLRLERFFSAAERNLWMTEWARLGSGSATRSALLESASRYVAWRVRDVSDAGRDTLDASGLSDASNPADASGRVDTGLHTLTEAVPAHPDLATLGHCVLVLDASEKEVSSSEGHRGAHTSVFQSIRVAGMARKGAALESALARGDFEPVRALSEEDAFAMHAVMQTAARAARYLGERTAAVIARFVSARDRAGAEALWTLDAGPNVHILFKRAAIPFVHGFLRELERDDARAPRVLTNLCHEGLVLGRAEARSMARRTLLHADVPSRAILEGLFSMERIER